MPTNFPPNCDKNAPTCGTAKTSPYDFVTTVVYPDCGGACPVQLQPFPCFKNGQQVPCPQPSKHLDSQNWWASTCTTPQCYGVPLYRQDINPGEQGTQPFIRMAGQSIAQRSTLTVNHGTYYMDTTVSEKYAAGSGYRSKQMERCRHLSTFLCLATPITRSCCMPRKQPGRYIRCMLLHQGDPFDPDTDVIAVKAHTEDPPITFDTYRFPRVALHGPRATIAIAIPTTCGPPDRDDGHELRRVQHQLRKRSGVQLPAGDLLLLEQGQSSRVAAH